MTAKTKGSFHPAVRVINSLYGLVYGVAMFAAPNFFFRPNGLFPFYWKTTSLESNDLDPITIHYLRVGGAGVTAMCLSHFLFFEDKNWWAGSCGRALSRMAVLWNVAYLPVCTVIVLDRSDALNLKSTVRYGVIHLFLAWYFLRLFQACPAPTTTPPVLRPTRIQRSAITVAGTLAGLFALARYFGGVGRLFFPKTPLENDEFDVTMTMAARMAGVTLLPLAVGALVDGRHAPQFVLKMGCVFGVLVSMINFKAAHDDTGYFDRNAFAVLAVVDFAITFLLFHAAGAFKKGVGTTAKKTV